MYGTREEWLAAAVDLARSALEDRAGLTVPRVRIGCGDLGERVGAYCYSRALVSDGIHEITISLRHKPDPLSLLGTVAHELIHASGVLNHHRDFAKAARDIGLVGRPTAAGLADDPADAPAWALYGVAALGEWPAPRLNRQPRRQSTRMLRVRCLTCGMIWRAAAVHLAGDDLRCPREACLGGLMIQGRPFAVGGRHGG